MTGYNHPALVRALQDPKNVVRYICIYIYIYIYVYELCILRFSAIQPSQHHYNSYVSYYFNYIAVS